MARTPEHPIEPIFVDRWSPRAMSGETLDLPTLQRLFEAARWAPSSANLQPWRFIYGRAGTPAFDALFGLLVEANQVWCKRAGALVVVVAKTTNDAGSPARTHLYDTGAAWVSLALQASRMGLVAHGMAGFDYDRARAELGVPDDHAVAAMIALGHPGPVEELPEKLRARETPSDRKPQATFVFEGRFTK